MFSFDGAKEFWKAASNSENKRLCRHILPKNKHKLQCINVWWFQSVAYAENFHGSVLVSWEGHMVVICIWCALFVTSFPCFQTNVSAKFVDIICIFFYIHSPYFMCHCTEYKLSPQVRLSEKSKLNATTQQFTTAKISGCALKQGNETRSSLRQSNLQL